MTLIEPKDLGPMKLKRYLIEKVEIGIQWQIPRHVLLNATLDQALGYASDEILYRLRSYLAGSKSETERVDQIIRVPLSWWDHVKERFAPKWFLKRWPIQYRTIEIKRVVTITNICPHIEVPNDDRRHFEVLFAGKI